MISFLLCFLDELRSGACYESVYLPVWCVLMSQSKLIEFGLQLTLRRGEGRAAVGWESPSSGERLSAVITRLRAAGAATQQSRATSMDAELLFLY